MNQKKILIVDDDEDFADLLKLKLEESGKYKIQVKNQGSQAIDAARGFEPDLILLDVMMPDMDGSELAERIKGTVDLRNVPIAFLTSIVRETEVESAAGIIGGRRFIAKTREVRKIIDSIDRILAEEASPEEIKK
jgi:CheY-like chemotaxis protein